MQKKLQKNENNKSSKLFINEEKTSKNKLKKDNGTDRKVDKIEVKNGKNSREKIKNELNSIELTPRKNARVKTREKKSNKNNIYVSVNNYSSNNNQGINIDINSKNILKLSPSIKDKSCSNSPTSEIIKRKNQLNDSNSDIISISEFINVLEKTKKSRPNNITLNELFNFQFSNDDNKILDSTSSTTSLLKLDNALLSLSEMYLLYNSNNKEEINIKKANCKDNDFCNIFKLCEEFTEKEQNEERKRKTNTNIIKKKPLLNYIDKIHQNKKEFRKIGGMKNNELIKNSEICQSEYEKCLFEIKKYSGIINLENLRKSYKNIKNMTDEELNNAFGDMVLRIKQKLPKNKAEKIAEDLYNLIYYENKYELIKRTIKKNK
jgi:hypothetical protein